MTITTTVGTAAIIAGLSAGAALAQDGQVSACLVTKTDINPFFVKMKQGAQAKAEELGINLSTYAGKLDGDADTQISAIESCIASGVDGILLAPNDSAALAPVIEQARERGILTIMLDTPLDPADAADATFATDNFAAGELIGKWAASKLGDAAQDAKLALLNVNAQQITVDYMRNQGFLSGFGVDVNDPTRIGDEDDARIVGNEITNSNEEGGRTAMETLLQIDPQLNVVYAINEPAAAGAYEAVKASGREDEILMVAIDGGCPGVQAIADGELGATSMQFPLRMAAMGVEAIAAYAKDGTLPEPSEGLDITNTGVELVTDEPVDGVPSMTSEEALEKCWG
jgi:fructose transport system substrate-binding protein